MRAHPHLQPPRAALVGALALAAVLVALPAALGASSRADDAGLGGVPNAAIVQSRCAALAVSTHVVRVGGTITFTAGPKHPEACNGSAGWSWPIFVGLHEVSGCATDGTSCVLKATVDTPLVQPGAPSAYITYPPGLSAYVSACLNGSSGFGSWVSCQYYAVVGPNEAVIDGTIKDKDGNPAAGIVVRALADGGSYSGVTGKDGYYAIEVKPGSYNVVPEAGSAGKHETEFRPGNQEVSLRAGDTRQADFELDGGIQVRLTISSATALANGYTILKGEITTTLYGLPDPGVTVALWPKSNLSPDDAVSQGPRAVICASSGARIWPGGTLEDPDGSPVNVTTDQDGHYDFTLEVGTVPGPFKLTAWARDASGQLIAVDTRDTSDDVDLSFTGAAPGAALHALDVFLDDLALYVVPKMTLSSNVALLAGQLSADSPSGSGDAQSTVVPALGGLAFAPGVGTASGYSLIVYPAVSPPAIDAKGLLTADPSALVLTPAEWSSIGAKVTYPVLSEALQSRDVQLVPTFAQWTAGADVGKGWVLKAQAMQVYPQSFQYYGWPYPSTTPGYCS